MDDGRVSGGAEEPKAVTAPHRPTIALPPRSTFESVFRGGADVSPGPMTLVSSFFNDDPDSECRSFSQLLAGAMASPVTSAAPQRSPPPAPASSAAEGWDQPRRVIVCENRPTRLVVSQPQSQLQSPFFMVPPGLSPGGLLESPAILSPNLEPYGMSHQQALAQVTAQAAQSHSHMHIQAEFSSSHSTATIATVTRPSDASINMAPFQQLPPSTSDANNNSFESGNVSHSSQRLQQPAVIVVDKPADDGYNWRKYGQKHVKGSEYPRSYYKCTHPNCPVKKKVERSLVGQVTEIIYKGQHNHQKPPPNRRAKDGGSMANGSNDSSGNLDFPDNAESSQGGHFSISSEISTRERESGHGASEQLSGSSDSEEVGNADLGQDEQGDSEPDPKRRVVDARVTESVISHRTLTEPRIIVQTTSEVDLLDDGYRWRKYGQKVVKGNPHPRSYYKCTHAGCKVRKHVERASTDSKAVITTYEGKHDHDVPAARNSSQNTASFNSAANSMHPKVHQPIPNSQPFHKRENMGNNVQRPVAVLQLKEEHSVP